MKTIIAGSRNVMDVESLEKAVNDAGWIITEVISGMASGVDQIGRDWAISRGIPVKAFPAQWKVYGRGAGPIRNQQMAEYAEALIAIWDGRSRGTKNMIQQAQHRNLMIHIHLVDPPLGSDALSNHEPDQ